VEQGRLCLLVINEISDLWWAQPTLQLRPEWCYKLPG
jgi:hypothetical protein